LPLVYRGLARPQPEERPFVHAGALVIGQVAPARAALALPRSEFRTKACDTTCRLSGRPSEPIDRPELHD